MGTIDELADTILRYVAERPDACDTLDGVCDWWLTRQRYFDRRTDVLAALELLTARGQIWPRTRADGTVLYRAHPLTSC